VARPGWGVIGEDTWGAATVQQGAL
jgi:hypothetical protein